MRNSAILLILIMLFALGCGKDQTGDGPSLKLDNISSSTIPPNSLVTFTFSFRSEKRADSIFVQKLVPDCTDSEIGVDESGFIGFIVPIYPESADKGDIELTFVNGFIAGYTDLRAPQCGEDDQATFRFVLKDIDGNLSDTITSPEIRIVH